MARQPKLPGMEGKTIGDLNDAGELYAKAEKAVVKARIKAAECREALVAALRKHGLQTYRDGEARPPWTLTVLPGTDRLKMTFEDGSEDGEVAGS